MELKLTRGDILERRNPDGQMQYLHVERVAGDYVDVIDDETGKPAGVNLHRDAVRVATMDDVLAHRARRQRAMALEGGA